MLDFHVHWIPSPEKFGFTNTWSEIEKHTSIAKGIVILPILSQHEDDKEANMHFLHELEKQKGQKNLGRDYGELGHELLCARKSHCNDQ